MSDTPETQAAVLASDGQWSTVLKETCERLERERDEARNLVDAAGPDADRLRGQLWKARDRAWKLACERSRWKLDCLEQCKLLAMSADREEKLIAKTGYWESLIHWLEQVQKAFEGQDRDWDLTQVYMRGPFAGWSQSDMVKLADKLWENEQKWPLRGDKK